MFKSKKKNKIIKFYYVLLCTMFVDCLLIIPMILCNIPDKSMTRSDWLALIANCISILVSICAAILVFLQTKYYKEKDEKEMATMRRKEIEPIFSLEIIETEERPCAISFKNVAEYPVRNVYLNDYYYYELLAMNSEKIIDLIDDNSLLQNDYGVNKEGYPQKIVVNYEDVDGNSAHYEYNLEYERQALYYKFIGKEYDIIQD